MEGAYVHFPLYESVHSFAWDSNYGWSAPPPLMPKEFEHNRIALLTQYGLYDAESKMRDVPPGVVFKEWSRTPET